MLAARLLRPRACTRALGTAAASDGAPQDARCAESFAPRAEAAVPFALSPTAARDKFEAWCRQRWLSPSALWDESDPECRVSASLLPFWAFDAVADVRYRGMVGFKSGGGKGATRWVAVREWRTETAQQLHRSEACMQTYAAFDLRRDHVAAAVSGPHAARAAAFAGGAAGARAAGAADAPPYAMGRGLAWALARRHVELSLRARCSAALRASAGADAVRDLECEVHFASLRATAVRLPAYVLRFAHGTVLSDDQSKAILRERFAAVVGGVTGAVGAERLLSPRKAQLAAAGPAAATAALAQLLAATPEAATAVALECAFLGATAAVLAGVAAKRLPYNWHTAAEAERMRACDASWEALRAEAGAGEWVDERVQAARDAAEWQRWEETGLWRWDAAGRAQWAATLLRGQAERARERRRWRIERAAEAVQAEEAARRAAAKQARWGDDWARGSATPQRGPQDPLGYYRLLGLADRVGVASVEEIKAAFRREAQRLHPDKHAAASAGDAAVAADAFRKLQAAYAVLRDPQARAQYSNGPYGG